MMDMVNWSAHGKAFCNQISRRIHLSKLLHECLPTFHQLNKYGGLHRPCPACASPNETRDHILRCLAGPTTSRVALQLLGCNRQDSCRVQNSPLLIYALRSALEDWFQSARDNEVRPILHPTDVRQLVTQQNAIGWRQLFNGRFSVKWAKLQHAYHYKHRTEAGNQRRDGTQWQVKLIVFMWDQWRLL